MGNVADHQAVILILSCVGQKENSKSARNMVEEDTVSEASTSSSISDADSIPKQKNSSLAKHIRKLSSSFRRREKGNFSKLHRVAALETTMSTQERILLKHSWKAATNPAESLITSLINRLGNDERWLCHRTTTCAHQSICHNPAMLLQFDGSDGGCCDLCAFVYSVHYAITNLSSLNENVAQTIRKIGARQYAHLLANNDCTSVLAAMGSALLESVDDALPSELQASGVVCKRTWRKLVKFVIKNLIFGYHVQRFDGCQRTAQHVTEITFRYRRLSVMMNS